MDPNATLEEMRRISKEILEARHDQEMTPGERFRSIETSATRLAELSQGLDEWLLKGGFLPKEWADQNKDIGFPEEVRDILWPEEEPDREWSMDTLDEIQQALANRGIEPPGGD